MTIADMEIYLADMTARRADLDRQRKEICQLVDALGMVGRLTAAADHLHVALLLLPDEADKAVIRTTLRKTNNHPPVLLGIHPASTK